MSLPEVDNVQKRTTHTQPATGIPMAAPMYTEGASAPAFQPPSQPDCHQWSVGLCDCFSDFTRCCISCWCPCITFGQISEIIDKGSSSCGVNGALYAVLMAITGCSCIYSCVYRTKMRKQYKLEGSDVKDCFTHCCCEPCALTQEYRELQNRGFDVSLGWHGNAERQRPTMAPTTMGDGMKR